MAGKKQAGKTVNKDAVVQDVDAQINALIERAMVAREKFLKLTQEDVDRVTRAMALAGQAAHMELARMAVEETGRGILEDKVTKNIFATEYVYHSIKYDKTVGVIEDNAEEDFMLVAEPVGIVCGVTPVTNPTSTTMFKSIISTKTRNPIIFAFHPSAQKCSSEAARIVRDAAVAAGAPEDCVLWVEYPSIEATQKLMTHPEVAVILATGGSGMVRAAYSSGKPALGVGSGNVPCIIDQSADIKQACNDLVMSKSFDNGMICASEQAAIVHQSVYKEVVKELKSQNVYFTTPEETGRLAEVVIHDGHVNSKIVGMKPSYIAGLAGIKVPENTRILAAEIEGVGPEFPLSREKLSPVLGVLKAKDAHHAVELADQMLNFGGLGHSAVLHAQDNQVIDEFSLAMKAGRIIINSPSTHGAIGDIYNTNMPSLTLGCGTYGGNSTTSNVSAVNLINVKRVAKRRVNMQWFKLPEKIYFEANSLQYLEKMQDISRVFIVTDEIIQSLGYVDKILYHLRKRTVPVQVEIFNQVEPDPSLETVRNGAREMARFNPDVIIALGGGSPIDAAKGMWLFYEQPDADFAGMAQKFLDIRKRVYKFPHLGKKAKLVAIPTTSGTGSEVTSFAVITDKEKGAKYPLADYELTPDVAIIDPNLVLTVPKKVTADTGLDVLTHAMEAYVSIMASDYTDALAMKAIQLVFDYLPQSYETADRKAREKMHNASCIAGMAFANAFLGVNHAIAHKLGNELHISHGQANAVLLPHVIEYNGCPNPTKVASFPKYQYYIAHEKYAEIAKMLGLPAKTPEEGVKSLANAVRDLMKRLDMPASLQEIGVDESLFKSKISMLANHAFEDQTTTANPRLPLISELEELLTKAYYGK
ncbi:bifunctional acetaldehyde-CoA/alcohol dehydrogenase [Salinisphaera sp. G21_0]|uniref:bifunctional acetaldehyde-CoA/alcohol dehydrogenase n=1 Tax=Salinisphaera sp. G21_0 TaxID=2821094 RepID=UPI001ADA35E3|nr:bifunctional acetaldehyde-CoA/alcohol dehydrogenase [Salinisphaera sp. G21_0]MBO9480514.1 bifunctional acetaldehyde-CoA/alcohol dehydrogenase [Salinisphaera sp. G21_0]